MQRAPGRPPLDDDDASVPVCLTLTAKQYDALYRRAQCDRVSVPEQIRRELREPAPAKKYRK